MATIKAHIIPATNTLSAWEAANPVILDGELVVVEAEDGVKRFKIGNGINTFNQLPFWHPEIDIDPDTKNWRIGGEDTGVTARATLDLRELTDEEREQMRGYPGPSVYELALRNNKTTAETEALWLDELGAPELERQENEAERIYEENRRNSNESDREAKELQRISNEAIRQSKDKERAVVYTQREKDEAARRSAEEVRDNKEIIREQQEQDREEAENLREITHQRLIDLEVGVLPSADESNPGIVKIKSTSDDKDELMTLSEDAIESKISGMIADKAPRNHSHTEYPVSIQGNDVVRTTFEVRDGIPYIIYDTVGGVYKFVDGGFNYTTTSTGTISFQCQSNIDMTMLVFADDYQDVKYALDVRKGLNTFVISSGVEVGTVVKFSLLGEPNAEVAIWDIKEG